MNFHRFAAAALLALAYLFTQASVAAPTVHYRTMSIDGVNVFYREAGPADAPAVVLLHGFPSSSNMFRNLIPALADRYHVIAPDYPGFGHSDMPDRTQFRYTFAHFADITDTLLTRLRVRSLCALCHGLRRARGLSRRAQASRTRHCARHSERQRVRGGAEGVLEADQGVLGERSAGAARGIARGHYAGGDALAVSRRCRRSLACRSERVGPWIRHCWIVPATSRSSSICSTTTARTSSCIRSSRNSSASGSRRR